jgi:uncharacterized protein YjiS (DUF1127 family)
MTYVTHSDHASIWQRLSDLSAHWADRRAQYRTYRSTLAELSAMSSHELTDLGIHPADIRRIAQEAAFGA